MNIHQRARRVSIGIQMIEEVLYDVLLEASEKGEGPLNRPKIQQRAGFTSQHRHSFNSTIKNILDGMERRGEVVNLKSNQGPDQWSVPENAG